MKYFLALIMVVFSSSLSAKVLTFECVPNQPKSEGTELHKFVVDMTNKTWEWEGYVFDNISVSGNAVTAKGSYVTYGILTTETFSVSRVDLTYTRRTKIQSEFVHNGQCEIVEDKVERAF